MPTPDATRQNSRLTTRRGGSLPSPRRRPLALAAALACAVSLVACGSDDATTTAPVATPPVATPTATLTEVTGQDASASATAEASSTPAGNTSARVTTPGADSCSSLAGKLSREQKIGQLFMVGTTAATGDSALRRAVAERHVGSVLYLGGGTRSVADTARLSRQVQGWNTDGSGVLVATDQEGGQVQRLSGPGFSEIPSAVGQAALGDEQLTAQWATWGAELRSAGVQYDLAPVADVVPASMTSRNQPIGVLRRGYGTTDEVVGAKASAVVKGLAKAHVASSLKHFPGLGRVTANTDFAAATDTVTTLDDTASFRTAMAAGASSVMVSSTVYARIDPDHHAMFSSKIITDGLRGQLGWKKVVISDDMGAAAAVSDVPVADRAARFIAAGGDLVIDADPASVGEMISGVEAKADADPAFAAALDEHVARVLALKAEVGLASCTA